MNISDPISFIEEKSVKPSMELGAFEALWANTVTSFKQLREKLNQSNTDFLSKLVDNSTSLRFYKKAIQRLKEAGIDNFGVRIEGTIDYPEKLQDADYPLVLFYYQGIWDLIFTRGVSVVGTRKPSEDAIKRTKRLVKELVKEDFTIYSGLAAGVDTAAHHTAIENGGKTIAVIGTPLWMSYPKENAELQKEIAKNHLLISQVPIVSYQPNHIHFTRMFFPERNKTMAALSEATIIVEAGETSGTLIQAKAALKQNRKVFILNNNFENSALSWPHKLQKLGAVRVYDIENIFEGLKNGI